MLLILKSVESSHQDNLAEPNDQQLPVILQADGSSTTCAVGGEGQLVRSGVEMPGPAAHC